MSELNQNNCALDVRRLSVAQDEAPERWLVAAWGGGPATLLAHADDGVIWGLCQGDTLHRAEIGPGDPWPPLRWQTLLSLRVFSDADGELRVWRATHGELRAARLVEVSGDLYRMMDRDYLLLGATRRAPSRTSAFEVLTSNRGERHAVPRGASKVRVRHYYSVEPETGLLRETEHRWRCLLNDQGLPMTELP